MGLFKKRNKIVVTDFIISYNAKHDKKTGKQNKYPVYVDGRIIWVPFKKLDSYPADTCAVCNGHMQDIDLALFGDWTWREYGIAADLPYNLCFSCASHMFREALTREVGKPM